MRKGGFKELLNGRSIRFCTRKSFYAPRGGIDYQDCHLNKREVFCYTAEGLLLFGGLGYLFFQEVFLAGMVSLGGCFYLKRKQREKGRKQKDRLAKEFIRGAEAFLNALEAGYSKENAVREAIRDLEGSCGRDSLILAEFIFLRRQLSINQPLEELFLDLGNRSGIEDIKTFGEIFFVAGKKGGNLVRNTKKTVSLMKEKQSLLQEIQTQTAARRLELRIMSLMLPGMVLYLLVFSPGFLDPLYHNWLGQLFMGALLLAYIGACCLGERITEIEI